MINQQGDVLLYQSTDGGEINVSDGIVEMVGGLETAAYLSLFGGNEDDDGSQNSPFQWWGNIGETQPGREYRSETQHLLQSIPATTGNLRRIENAARRDLAWFTQSVASEIEVEATIPGVNRVAIAITIIVDNARYRFDFDETWKGIL